MKITKEEFDTQVSILKLRILSVDHYPSFFGFEEDAIVDESLCDDLERDPTTLHLVHAVFK